MPRRTRTTVVLCALSAAAPALVGVPLTSAQSSTGSIEGRVTFQGTPPAPASVIESGGQQPVLYIDGSGGLRYAVVYLPDAEAGPNRTPTDAVINQRGYVFRPQVLAVRAGQTVRFTNDDPANHNVRAQDANAANTFSVNTASGSPAATHGFAATSPDGPIQLTCDIHPWMAAWVYVFKHSQFGVTDAAGRFRIDDVPAGRYRLAVRQPAGRLARDLSVDVNPGRTTHVDVPFTASDVGMPTR